MASDDIPAAQPQADGAAAPAGAALPAGLIQRPDGIFVDPAIAPPALAAAVNQVFLSRSYFAGLHYPTLVKLLYDVGPPLAPQGGAFRLADAVKAFDPQRLSLYKAPKMGRGYAEYYFEPLYLEAMELPDGTIIPERLTRLNVDEFVADMWIKGIRFGIDVAAVAAAIAAAKSDRITVAHDLDPTAGQDAEVLEVSHDIHRSDAPREKADGRVDLLSFQNRFPQIKENMRLLKKRPPMPGMPGYDMAGRPTAADAPKDLDLRFLAGDGTRVELQADGEYLVSTRIGFLNVDTKSQRISINEKIVSTEGVSGRTTGNLQLEGAYEEYGDVQELREVNGSDITVHGHVYGNINSRGGKVQMDQNLVGGHVHNVEGDILVKGVASGATLQTKHGTITIGRAENCVISANKVVIEEASCCEIIAEEIRIGVAEGCAVAGRNVEMESAGPRRRTEMLIYVLVRDVGKFDEEIADLDARVAGLVQTNAAHKAEIERLSLLPDVRRYLALAAKLRTQELTLTPEQGLVLRKISSAVATELQAISKEQGAMQAGLTQQKLLEDRLVRVLEQKQEAAGIARCGLHMVDGDTLVRTMPFAADGAAMYLLPAKDIKQRLRGSPAGGQVLFADSAGSFDWHLDVRRKPAPDPQ